jgi:ethanolamine kinase
MGSCETAKGANGANALRYIPLTYSSADSQSTALRLILTLFPDWEGAGNKIEFVRFTDGITNTVRMPTCTATSTGPVD